MGGPFRGDVHAAMQRIDALQRENARLVAVIALRGAHAKERCHRMLERFALITLGLAAVTNLATVRLVLPETAQEIRFAGLRGSPS